MNRVAAQNARDKRKRYIEELERRLVVMEAKVCVVGWGE